MQTELTVTPGTQASGHFCTIQDAIDSIPSDNHTPVTIRIAPGIYREKLTLEKPCVTLLGLGDSPSDTVLSYDDFGNDTMPDGADRRHVPLLHAVCPCHECHVAQSDRRKRFRRFRHPRTGDCTLCGM